MPAPTSDRPRLHVDVVRRAREGAAYGLAPWLVRVAPGRARGRVTVALVSDSAMRSMNLRYRGVDRATDVLSFAASPSPMSTARVVHPSRAVPAQLSTPALQPQELGDIAIARGVAARQARAHGHTVRTEVRVLALHGLLHLLGYDHEQDGGAMARVESRLRRRGGLPAGLIARGHAVRRGERSRR